MTVKHLNSKLVVDGGQVLLVDGPLQFVDGQVLLAETQSRRAHARLVPKQPARNLGETAVATVYVLLEFVAWFFGLCANQASEPTQTEKTALEHRAVARLNEYHLGVPISVYYLHSNQMRQEPDHNSCGAVAQTIDRVNVSQNHDGISYLELELVCGKVVALCAVSLLFNGEESSESVGGLYAERLRRIRGGGIQCCELAAAKDCVIVVGEKEHRASALRHDPLEGRGQAHDDKEQQCDGHGDDRCDGSRERRHFRSQLQS